MALKLLQPGLRPMGQFLFDTSATVANLTGGEVGEFALPSALETAPADVIDVGPRDISSNNYNVHLTFASTLNANITGTTAHPVVLMDEGDKGYGTLFGDLIGATVGQATSQSGATVIGPATHLASGKVTAWHAPGLYGLTTDQETNLASTTGAALSAFASGTDLVDAAPVNSACAASSGKWSIASSAGDLIVGYIIGEMYDSSLVSSTAAAAGESAAQQSVAVYFAGTAGSILQATVP